MIAESRKEYQKAWYDANKEHVVQYKREWRRANIGKVRERQRLYRQTHLEQTKGYERKSRHGITPDDYDAMRTAQENKCAICLQETALVIDHNHSTGKIRGLLCNDCNSGIGFLDDSIATMERAIEYLKRDE